PQNPSANQSICINVTASPNATTVQLWWRAVGPFQRLDMFDDGAHCDGAAGDGVYGATIPAQAPGSILDYYTLAQTAAADMSFLPRNADFGAESLQIQWSTGTSPIHINEFVAQNVTGIVDENSQHEDWLELYNDSTVAVDASGMWLTDDLSRTKYQLRTGTIIPARGTLLVWCDEDGTQGPYHANFKLSASGEAVGLFASDGVTLVDSFVFGTQVADIATGRLYDGQGPWVSLPTPTPAARNEIAFCGTRSYTALASATHRLRLALSGSPQIGTAPILSVSNGPANGSFSLSLSTGPAYLPLGFVPMTLLLEPAGMTSPIALPFDGAGSFSTPLPVPADPQYIGMSIFLQTFAVDALSVTASNALETKICP
ncbi:MAG: lamin tail domain-containing protein, partial [Planctomycetes bacterium]|nr:lamin tail domain-containing protein [Planctomycetota bacterium]